MLCLCDDKLIVCKLLQKFLCKFISKLSQHDAEEALAEALPALEAARLALDDLDKSDVTEIRYDKIYCTKFLYFT